MKAKLYRVRMVVNGYKYCYVVEAPTKYIAKWVAANIYMNEYAGFCSIKDVVSVERADK